MSLKNLIVSGAAALALMGTAALASTAGNNGVVTVENDGVGDYLLTPVYYAVHNWSTTLKVVNTNTTRAVVAKVVLRDSKQSKEILDFAIYLTPGDVWEGTIKDLNGKIAVVSSDDSMIIGGTPASKNSPITVGGVHPLVETNQGCTRVNWHGYVEIFGLASYDAQSIATSGADGCLGSWSEGEPLDKLCFYNAVKVGNKLANDYNVSIVDDSLMGKATIYAESSDVNGRRTMMLNMLALEGVSEIDNDHSLTDFLNTDVIGVDTTPDDVSPLGTDFVPRMDKALGKSHIYVMYEGDGSSLYPIRTHFTVPTKKYWYSNINIRPNAYTLSDEDGNPNTHCTSDWYYMLDPDSTHKVVFRDYQEHSNQCNKTTEVSGVKTEDCGIPIREEVHFFQDTDTNSVSYDAGNPIRDYAFKDGGYIDFDLSGSDYTATDENNNTLVSFDGMPIVPTTFYAKDVQGIYLNNWLYNQYKDATEN